VAVAREQRTRDGACDNAAVPFGIGQWELIVLGAVLVLLFGTSRVPQIARQLGLGLRDLRRTVEDVDPRRPLRELEQAPEERPEPADAAERR
jgi:TatA/E family protein of Tat protein translocase